MKKILLSASVVLVCFFISCNDKPPAVESANNSKASKNLEASHVVNDAFGSGITTSLDSVIDENFLDHTDRGEIKGRDSMKAMVAMVHKTNKDMKMEIIKEVADDDYVFSWMRFTGTSDGTMMPAGPYDMKAIEVIRFSNGKIVEHWEFMEPGDVMKMMKAMAPPPAPPSCSKKSKEVRNKVH